MIKDIDSKITAVFILWLFFRCVIYVIEQWETDHLIEQKNLSD